MIGPRVYYAMAEQGLLFRKLAQVQPKLGTPAFAILLQTAISVVYILVFGFGGTLKLLIFMGFALSFFPWLRAGVCFLRTQDGHHRQPPLPLAALSIFSARLSGGIAVHDGVVTHLQHRAVAVGNRHHLSGSSEFLCLAANEEITLNPS
jgi:amino acid transporter